MDAELCASMNEKTHSENGTELLRTLREKIHLDPREVSECAYAVWESCGRPQGQDQAHWFQAEAQLLFDAAQDRGLLESAGREERTTTSHPRGKQRSSAARPRKTARKRTPKDTAR